jgi:hypothetical protein
MVAHEVMSCAERWMLFAPLLEMQMRSDMASTEPNAQHDPQLAWSRISLTVGQLAARGSVRPSKLVGSATDSSCFTSSFGLSRFWRVPWIFLASSSVAPSKLALRPAVHVDDGSLLMAAIRASSSTRPVASLSWIWPWVAQSRTLGCAGEKAKVAETVASMVAIARRGRNVALGGFLEVMSSRRLAQVDANAAFLRDSEGSSAGEGEGATRGSRKKILPNI